MKRIITKLIKDKTKNLIICATFDNCIHEYIKNIKNGQKVRKLLRDAIEADVMERKITYFDKI